MMVSKNRTSGIRIIRYVFILSAIFLLIFSTDIRAMSNVYHGVIYNDVNDVAERIVAGKVVDKRGKPLEGAVVMSKDGRWGTRTDAKGRFSITVKSNDVLSFSYVGKEMQSIFVGQQKNIKIRLNNVVWVLEDVIPIFCLEEGTEDTFESVEVMPEFRENLFQWLAEQIKYPEEAYKKGIEGEVQVSFIINEKGIVKKVKVAKSINALLDREAVRVVKSMPVWEPAKQSGKNVEIECLIPVNFFLKKQ